MISIEMTQKREFYEKYRRARNTLTIEPETEKLSVWTREADILTPVVIENEWIKSLVRRSFRTTDWEQLRVYHPNGVNLPY